MSKIRKMHKIEPLLFGAPGAMIPGGDRPSPTESKTRPLRPTTGACVGHDGYACPYSTPLISTDTSPLSAWATA